VPSPGIVEALDVVEHVRPGVIPRPVDLAGCPLGFSVFSDEKKRSIAVLSQTLPDRLIEQVMPWGSLQALVLVGR
jgi:hypothetical protein